ncbi:MAG: dehydrogenase [Saprospiraceae bacterium]|nr:dehydrogenase [Saprospiraceae bacterium]
MPTIAQSNIVYQRGSLSNAELLALHQHLLRPRMIEEKMLILLRQGKISKWFSGIGQEAISVGVTMALQADEFLFPLHRNLGVFTVRQVPLERLFAQWQGKMLGFTKGRDRSFHFGTMEHHIVGMISHLGPQLALANGVALAHLLANEQKLSVAFTGDGGTSEGDFHEALNVAAVWQLPVIFVIENNGYGLSTPTQEQYRCQFLAERAKGYGMEGITIDGNNILEVYQTVKAWAEKIRTNPQPLLLECLTFRMRGHEEASGTKYVPQALMDEWAAKDPVSNFEQYLLAEGVLTETALARLRKTIKQEIEQGLEIAFAADDPVADTTTELADVFQPFSAITTLPTTKAKSEKRFVDAIADGLRQAMQRHEKLILMGQDIADYGGVFKITEGLVKEFGKARVRNTPLCESAIIGAGLGLSLKGWKAMVEMQFADFVSCGFNQIVNNLAKLHYRWGQNADVVVRMPTGAGVGAGPFHSQSNEAWFAHVAGLKVVYPSSVHDAKGLLLASFEDPNPVIFFEHKALYRKLIDHIPDDYYTVPIGVAKVERTGNKATIITYGAGVHWAKETVEKMQADVEIIDLRTLQPLDHATIAASVQKTHKALILHEDNLFVGIGGEIAAYLSEHLFEYLDAPIMRVASLDTPIPMAKSLEDNFLPVKRLEEKLTQLLHY